MRNDNQILVHTRCINSKNITWQILTILLSQNLFDKISDYLYLGKSKYLFHWWTWKFFRNFRQDFHPICFLGNQKFPHFHTLETYYETRLFGDSPTKLNEKDPLKIIADVFWRCLSHNQLIVHHHTVNSLIPRLIHNKSYNKKVF